MTAASVLSAHVSLRSYPEAKIGWASFSVPRAAGDLVASRLLDRANDPLVWSLAIFGATVIRRKCGEHDEFYLSPPCVEIFEDLMQQYGGGRCDPPRARTLKARKTSRLLLGFKTWWDPF